MQSDMGNPYLWLVTFKALGDLGEKYGVALKVRHKSLTNPPPMVFQVHLNGTVVGESEDYKETLDTFLAYLEREISNKEEIGPDYV